MPSTIFAAESVRKTGELFHEFVTAVRLEAFSWRPAGGALSVIGGYLALELEELIFLGSLGL
jgi:hypothetical protein